MQTKLAVKTEMADLFSLRSSFATSIISKIINRLVRKNGFDAKVTIKEVTASHVDADGRVKLHLDLYVDASERDIRKLIG